MHDFRRYIICNPACVCNISSPRGDEKTHSLNKHRIPLHICLRNVSINRMYSECKTLLSIAATLLCYMAVIIKVPTKSLVSIIYSMDIDIIWTKHRKNLFFCCLYNTVKSCAIKNMDAWIMVYRVNFVHTILQKHTSTLKFHFKGLSSELKLYFKYSKQSIKF